MRKVIYFKWKQTKSFKVSASYRKFAMLSNFSGIGPENWLFSIFLLNKRGNRHKKIKTYKTMKFHMILKL
jgi:hypothetical protein